MWLGIFRIIPPEELNRKEHFIYYLLNMYMVKCMCLRVCVVCECVCTQMMCHVYEWHVETLGIVPLNYPFWGFLRQNFSLAWRLTKLSRLGSQWDPQIQLSLPPIIGITRVWNMPSCFPIVVSQDCTQCLVRAHTTHNPESIFNLNESTEVLRELPCKPTRQSRKTSYSMLCSICNGLGIARESRYCVCSADGNLM